MLPQMVRQMFFSGKTLLAELAAMRGVPRVYPNVVIKVLLPRESLRTEVAPVRRLPRVLSHVVCQVFFPCERFGAVLAFVRGLTCNNREILFHFGKETDDQFSLPDMHKCMENKQTKIGRTYQCGDVCARLSGLFY